MTQETRLPLSTAAPDEELRVRLCELVPHVFTEGRIDFDKLKAALGEHVEQRIERYGLNWAGKAEAMRNVQTPSVGTLLPMPEESVNWDTAENLIIEGDNLEVLKLLQKSYHGKVKMIYIDPPYNTGNEFIYPDNYREGLDDYLRYSGQVSEDGAIQSTNTETSGRFHSKWLSMMYPRLFLARNLLQEDGVIFVSIDDNEVYNLRMLMNEVFGEENFLGQITVVSNPKGRVLGEHFARCHDYLLVFCRSGLAKELTLPKGEEEISAQYKEKDDRGYFRSLELRNTHRQFGRHNRRNMYFAIWVNPRTGQVALEEEPGWISVNPIWDDGFEGCWTWGPEKARSESALLFGRLVQGRWKIFRKSYAFSEEGEVAEKKLKSVWDGKEFITEKGQAAFDKLVPGRIFQSPKPVDLVKTLIKLCDEKDMLCLDFFAGSGTTGQAVLELNRLDDGDRKFIAVQLPEKTLIPEFPTISCITRERVRKAVNSTREGFRAFRLSASNFRIWHSEKAPSEAAPLKEQLKLHAANVDQERDQQDILYELIVKSGLPLSAKVEKIDVADVCVWSVSSGDLLICLEKTVTHEALRALLGHKPKRLLCLDTAFGADDALKTNVVLEAKSLGVLFHTV